MAIRLDPNLKALAVIGGIILLVLLLVLMVAALLAMGCAAAKVEEMELEAEAAVVKVSDESASPTTTAGDDATITNVNFGTGVGCIALLPLLGLLGWRYRTIVVLLTRLAYSIEREDKHPFAPKVCANKSLRMRIEGAGCVDGKGKPDRAEVYLRKLLLKLK